MTVSPAIVVLLFPLLIFIFGAFGSPASVVLLLGLDSSQGVWRFHVFEVVFSIWRFGDVFDFFIVVVVPVVFAPLVVIIVVLLIFIREIKLDPKLTFPLALNNKLLGRLVESQHIPAFIKLLDSAN